MRNVLDRVGGTLREAWAWFRMSWAKAIITVLAVAVVSLGAIRMEGNQNAIKHEQAARIVALQKTQRQIQHTQKQTCRKANDTNDGIRNILTYLDQRRAQASTAPLTMEQAATEAHVRELIPAHQDC